MQMTEQQARDLIKQKARTSSRGRIRGGPAARPPDGNLESVHQPRSRRADCSSPCHGSARSSLDEPARLLRRVHIASDAGRSRRLPVATRLFHPVPGPPVFAAQEHDRKFVQLACLMRSGPRTAHPACRAARKITKASAYFTNIVLRKKSRK